MIPRNWRHLVAFGQAAGVLLAAVVSLSAACRRHARLSPETVPRRPSVLEVQRPAATTHPAPDMADPPTLGNLFDRVLWALDVLTAPRSTPDRRTEARAVLTSARLALERLAVEPDGKTVGGADDATDAVVVRRLLYDLSARASAAAAVLDEPAAEPIRLVEARDRLVLVAREVIRVRESLTGHDSGRKLLRRRLVPGDRLDPAPTAVPSRLWPGEVG